MLTPVAWAYINAAIASRTGWLELAVIGVSFAAGWWLDRRVRLRSESDANVVRVGLGSVNRLLLPLLTLALLVVATALFRHFEAPVFFLPIAIPLTIALGAIRLLVYAMRELFGAPAWLPSSERVLSFAIWGFVLLHFIGAGPELWAELDALDIPIGTKHVTVLELLKGLVVLILTLAGTLWVSGLIEGRLLRADHIDVNVRVVAGKIVRAILLTIAVLIALQAVGIDLTLLTVFGGALGVGIGLGLQKLASNYIAGFAILLDRSIRLGDMITVDNRFGIVTKVMSRYVIVRSLDGVASIVPNETLVTTTVLNHSFSSREFRVAVTVQVGHDTDVEFALKLMLDAAMAEPRVLKSGNTPTAFVTRLGENGIELELGVWINDPENGQGNLRSALNLSILRAFRTHEIEIPRPQRRIHLVGLPEGLLAADKPEGADPAS